MQKDSRIFIGETAELFYWLDSAFENLAKKHFGIVNAKVPIIIDDVEIERLGYKKSFAGHLTKVLPHLASEQIKDSKYLIPAACLPIYPVIASQKTVDNQCVTFRTPVFRYEEGNRSAFRMWEFTVREIVFVGTHDFVLQALKKLEKEIIEFCASLSIPIKIEAGSDYFTGDSKRMRVLQKMQKANDLKREMILKHNNDVIALGSINYHGDHFSKIYHFDKDSTIVSGCIGFGLERWVTACQMLGYSPPAISH